MSAPPFFVSTIVPVYNGEAFLEDAVASVQRQSCESMEIIIVDDGSTDSTAAIAAGFGDSVRYEYQENRGPAAARNRALELCRGQMIGFLDVDDLWSDDKLELQLRRMADDPALLVAMGHTQFLDQRDSEDGVPQFEAIGEPCIQMLLGGGLFRRSVFDVVGVFDETLSYCEDWDWFMRAKELDIPMVIHPERVLFYRRHAGNMTRDKTGCDLALLKIIRKSLKRRRQKGIDMPLPHWSDYADRAE